MSTSELRARLEELTGGRVGSKNREHLLAKVAEAESPTFNLVEQDRAFEIPLDLVDESPLNKRRLWGDLDGLAASIRSKGVQQPGTVRPIGDRYEIVFGHRRYRASGQAGRETFPAFVRELSDREVLDLQIIENLQRQDVHPLDEAAWYHELHVTHHVPVDEIAGRIGKSRSHVYARLKLMDLSPVARDAFLDGSVPAAVAVMIARVPHEDLQKKIIEDLVSQAERYGHTLSVRDASATIQRDYMMRLESAPFDTTDAKLVEGVGTCAACPKRTGNQPELFADVEATDLCTDPVCHKGKREATVAARFEKAERQGHTVLTPKASKKLLPCSGGPGGPMPHDSPYVDLDAICIDDEKHRTWRKVLKASKPAVTVGVDAGGVVRDLVTVDDARKGAAESGLTVHLARSGQSDADKKADERHKLESEASERARVKALSLVAAVAEKRKIELPVMRMLVSGLAMDDDEGVLERRGFDWSGDDPDAADKAWSTWLADANEKQVRGVMVELFVAPMLRFLDVRSTSPGIEVLTELGIDWKALVTEAKKDLRAEARAKAKEDKAKGGKTKITRKPKDKATKPADDDVFDEVKCRVCGCTDSMACEGGCTWVEADLCSSCADKGGK